MKTKNKIFTGIILSTLLATGLFAVNGEMKNDNNKPNCMMKKDAMHKGKDKSGMQMINMFKQLNLSVEQETQIEKIMIESKENMQSLNDAFTNENFDKGKYIKIMTEKRDNMLKSEAEIIDKSYAVLTSKQKEQLKVLMDLRKEKMSQRFENKIKG